VERTGIMAESWNSRARRGSHSYATAGRQQLKCGVFNVAPWIFQVAPRFTGNCAGLVKIVKGATKII
jgi:hypothetical protein